MAKPLNDNPFAPWNDPMYSDNPFAPHNNPMREDDPFEPWNSPSGSAEDLNDEDRARYGLSPQWEDEDEEE